jgi:hypothetical protein
MSRWTPRSARSRALLVGSLAIIATGMGALPASGVIGPPQARGNGPDLLTLSQLYGVSAISSNDVWAVGVTYLKHQDGSIPLAQHWDGSTWTSVPCPSPHGLHGQALLQSVSAVASGDVWAVGYDEYAGVSYPLLDHWDGTAWTLVPMQVPPKTQDFILDGVSASSSDDVWAVGHEQHGRAHTKSNAVFEHFDGSAWTRVRGPGPREYPDLVSVDAIASDDVWAVGSTRGVRGAHGSEGRTTGTATLAEHWNGETWTRIPTPSPGGTGAGSVLESVTGTTSTDVWAVGTLEGDAPLAEHWDGESWQRIPCPAPTGALDAELHGVSAVSSDDVWAVGEMFGDGFKNKHALIEHWNGTAWRPLHTPASVHQVILQAVDATAADDASAVGLFNHTALEEHWDGQHWS